MQLFFLSTPNPLALGFGVGKYKTEKASFPKSKPNGVGLIWKRKNNADGRSDRGLQGQMTLLRYSDVAGMAGLEPTISESKSGVLPLHYIPMLRVSSKKETGGRRPLSGGVGYGARTHDTRNHNPVLYQLS